MRGGEGDSENPSDSGHVGTVAVMTIGGQIHTTQTHICRKLPGIFQENGKGNQEAVNAASCFSEILLLILGISPQLLGISPQPLNQFTGIHTEGICIPAGSCLKDSNSQGIVVAAFGQVGNIIWSGDVFRTRDGTSCIL